MQCPTPNSFQYNSTLCFCNPGYLYNDSSNSCTLFTVHPDDWVVGSGVDNSINFPETIFSFDSIKKYTQSQAVFLEATLVMIVIWLLFCFGARFGSLGDGRTRWFKIRWWISRLDICFATRHWLDDQKVMKKRKTELGGTFSIASWILFIGLLAALLYQIISKRTVEMHSVRATNAPELALFMNDMEFNITTISSMSCSNLRGLGTLVTGSPGFIDSRVTPLSAFVSYSCHNTTKGPTITLKCNNCQLIRDNAFISWQFIDLPNDPATAVGFEFNLTAKSHASNKHLSFVSGKLKNGSTSEEKSITYRGRDPNVLKFNLFPRIYHNHHDLRLIQPLFHDFLPGSSFSDRNQLQSSLQSSNDGLINTTLYINFLSAYVVEIDNQDIFGPVSFLADLGGLYCISIGIFFYFLVQCEYRVKKFRNEDNIMRRIRSRRKAQEHWNKLRKYVRFTWGCTAIPPEYESAQGDACCSGFMVEKHGSSRKRKQQHKLDTISLNRKVNLPGEKKSIPEENHIQLQGVKSCLVKSASNLEGRSSCASGRQENSSDLQLLKNVKTESASGLLKKDVSPDHVYAAADDQIPLPPSIDIARGSEISVSDIQRNIENLYEYNVMLRERLVVAQSVLNALTTKGTTFSAAEKKLLMTQVITEIP